MGNARKIYLKYLNIYENIIFKFNKKMKKNDQIRKFDDANLALLSFKY